MNVTIPSVEQGALVLALVVVLFTLLKSMKDLPQWSSNHTSQLRGTRGTVIGAENTSGAGVSCEVGPKAGSSCLPAPCRSLQGLLAQSGGMKGKLNSLA